MADELIFQPLKMTSTSYVWSSKVDSTRLAIGYDKEGSAYETFKNKIPNAADDLLTTVEDYGKFLVSIMNSEGLSKNVFKEMTSSQVAIRKGINFGLGFVIYTLDSGEIALSHSGSDHGVQTLFVIFPKTKNGLLIFTNSDTGVNLYETLLKHYLGNNGQKIFDIEMK